MKSYLKFILFVLFSSSLFGQNSHFKITVINLPADSVFQYNNKPLYFYGNVKPIPDSLFVNESKANLTSNGAFMVYTNPLVELSNLQQNLLPASINFRVFRNNEVSELIQNIYLKPDIPELSKDSLKVDWNWKNNFRGKNIYAIGDMVDFEFRATEGCNAFVKIGELDTLIPLEEVINEPNYYWGESVFGNGFRNSTEYISGIYRGNFILKEELDSSDVDLILEKDSLRKDFQLEASLSSVSFDEMKVIETKFNPNLITGRFGPGLGYKLFLQEGIKLKYTGEVNGWVKAELANDELVYLPKDEVKILKQNYLKRSEIQLVRVEESDKTVNVKFGVTEKVAVDIKQRTNPQTYLLTFYNIDPNIDWVYFNPENKLIKEVNHYSDKNHTLKFEITLNSKAHWGYSAVYEDNIFVLKIRKPAVRNKGFIFGANQLEGRRIVIDPGHSPETGAVGPTGLSEKEINFNISNKLKQRLENEGAIVSLTRNGIDFPLPLRQRREKVIRTDSDISISFHNNAVPQGVNPLDHNGFSVYYYYPQALELAKMIYENFETNLEINNFGFYWDNLYMCRITESISLLIEPSFIIMPEQEMLLQDDEFQNEIIDSIIAALRQFYEDKSE